MIGIILGIGMQIKYLVIMDILGLVLLGSWFKIGELNKREYEKAINSLSGLTKGKFSFVFNHLTFSLLRFYLILGAGIILPAIIIGAIYYFSGYFDEYIYATLIANSKYIGILNFSWSDFLSRLKKQILGNILLWLCFFWSCLLYTSDAADD